jgi:hypothetical protein
MGVSVLFLGRYKALPALMPRRSVVAAEAGIDLKEQSKKKVKSRQKVNKMIPFIFFFSFYYAVIERCAREYLS